MFTKKKKKNKENGHGQTIWLSAFPWLKEKKREKKKIKGKEKERATFVGRSRLENSSPNDISYEQLKIRIRKELSKNLKYEHQHPAHRSPLPEQRSAVGWLPGHRHSRI